MTIGAGSAAVADEVMNAFGMICKNQSNLIWNADLIGLDSDLEEEFEKVKYDTIQNDTSIDTSSDAHHEEPIFPVNVLDNFEDASIDATIWSTSGTVTESGGSLSVSGGGAIATADGASTVDFNQAVAIFTKVRVNSEAGTGPNRIRLVDESANEVTLWEDDAARNNVDFVLRFEVEPGSNNVQVYVNDVLAGGAGSAVDVTSLTDGDAWYLKLYNNIGSGTAGSSNFRYFQYLPTAGITDSTFISTATTASSTITNAILCVSDDQTSGNIQYQLSADNGSNYENVTPNQIHRFTNTGTQLKVKALMDSSTAYAVPILYHYAAFYNFY